MSWSLFRRLLLVLIGVFVTNFNSRHFALLIGLLWILLVDVVTWPYRYHYDNFFSVVISWLLVVIAILTEPGVYLYFDPRRGVRGALVVGGVVSGLVLAVVERVLWRRGDSVDGVVERLVKRWRLWRRRERGGKKESDERLETSNTVEVTSPLPRFRESLLEQFPLESSGKSSGQSPAEMGRERRKGWNFRRKKNEDQSYNLTINSNTSSSVASTSVAVSDLDSGLATIQYNRRDSK